jgi:hypothetical protein
MTIYRVAKIDLCHFSNMLPDEKQQVLLKIVTDPISPASYSGVQKISKELKRQGITDISPKEIKGFLQTQDAHTLFKGVRSKFPRPRIIVNSTRTQYGSDLLDLSKYARKNSNFKHLLILIDMFSRFLWVVPLKSKKPAEVIRGFETIFNQQNGPSSDGILLQTDQGSEYLAGKTQEYFKNKKIKHFTSKGSAFHNPLAERVIKTLKNKLYKYMTVNNSHKYLEVLPKIIFSYNHSWHRSIKARPSQVNVSNEWLIWKNLYLGKSSQKTNKKQLKLQKFQFKRGDSVLISYQRNPFHRSFDLNWSPEIFTISVRSKRGGVPIYQLNDYNKNPISGNFYTQELQKIPTPTADKIYQIEKVIKTRKRGRKTQYLVKWRFYPKSANSWINEEELMDISETNIDDEQEILMDVSDSPISDKQNNHQLISNKGNVSVVSSNPVRNNNSNVPSWVDNLAKWKSEANPVRNKRLDALRDDYLAKWWYYPKSTKKSQINEHELMDVDPPPPE